MKEAEESVENKVVLPTALSEDRIPLLQLQRNADHDDRDHYQLADLLRYHDRVFVTYLYAAIAKRSPSDVELARMLDELRSGRRRKVDLVAELLSEHSAVHVLGLPSPIIRRLSQWPIIGYPVRLLRGIARLPLLIRDQQQFETYAFSHLQRIEDYLNEVIVPAVKGPVNAPPALKDVVEKVNEAVATVMMLSDGLVDLSSKQAELQAAHERSERQLHADLVALTQGLATLQRESQQQREQSETQLHKDLVALSEQLAEQQRGLTSLRTDHEATRTAQREFLIEELRLTVEAKQIVLSDIQDQLLALAREQAAKHAELLTDLNVLRSFVDPIPATDRRLLSGHDSEQT
jgi:hypothetical protein